MNSVILVVLDGFGVAPPSPGNAIFQAHPSNLNSFMYSYPYTQLKASGEAVGLPAGEVGNTEVGHLNLGAGRVIYQSLLRINTAIADGSFYKNIAFLEALLHLNKTRGKLHLLGLVSEGMVHASIEHLYALLYFCKQNQFTNIFIHAITDGRDSPPKMAMTYLTNLQRRLDDLGFGEIATVTGRYYAMDRDRRWERTEKAYLCLTQGLGEKALSWREAVERSYQKNKTDEFIDPTVIVKNGQPTAVIEAGDAVIFYNFRIDRPRQLAKAFVLDNFAQDANKISYDAYRAIHHHEPDATEKILTPPFKRGEKIKNLYFISMTEYERLLPTIIAFPSHIVTMGLARILSENTINQLHMAESEKERFVTYYFNGERESQFPYEDRLIIASPKVPTYDLKPEMSAFEITDNLLRQMSVQKYKFILVNFANPDMVAHTGNLQAGIAAIQAIDRCLGRIFNLANQLDYTVIITADHGNIEEMIDLKTGEVSTEHTNNPVPFIVIGNQFRGRSLRLNMGILADVAPTILDLMKIPKSTEMTGRNLLEEMR